MPLMEQHFEKNLAEQAQLLVWWASIGVLQSIFHMYSVDQVMYSVCKAKHSLCNIFQHHNTKNMRIVFLYW